MRSDVLDVPCAINSAIICASKFCVTEKLEGKLCTLLDMLKFNAHKFVMVIALLARIRSLLEDNGSVEWTAGSIEALSGMTQDLVGGLTDLGLPMSLKSAIRLMDSVNAGDIGRESDFANQIATVQQRIEDELEGKITFSLKPEAELFYAPVVALFGQAVDVAFPSAAFDIAEAGKCLALERYTACVSHLMRALESPLMALAQDQFGAKPLRDNWGDLLVRLELQIPKEPDKIKRAILSAAATQFRFFKDAWRNEVMHQRGKYTEEEARSIISSTKTLCNDLAKVVKE